MQPNTLRSLRLLHTVVADGFRKRAFGPLVIRRPVADRKDFFQPKRVVCCAGQVLVCRVKAFNQVPRHALRFQHRGHLLQGRAALFIRDFGQIDGCSRKHPVRVRYALALVGGHLLAFLEQRNCLFRVGVNELIPNRVDARGRYRGHWFGYGLASGRYRRGGRHRGRRHRSGLHRRCRGRSGRAGHVLNGWHAVKLASTRPCNVATETPARRGSRAKIAKDQRPRALLQCGLALHLVVSIGLLLGDLRRNLRLLRVGVLLLNAA